MRVVVNRHKCAMIASDRLARNTEIDDPKSGHPIGSKVESVRTRSGPGFRQVKNDHGNF
jgi:hypothetical protein